MSQFLLGKPTASEIKAAILKCNGIKLDRNPAHRRDESELPSLIFFISKLRVLTVKMQLQTMSFRNIVIMVFAEI